MSWIILNHLSNRYFVTVIEIMIQRIIEPILIIDFIMVGEYVLEVHIGSPQ